MMKTMLTWRASRVHHVLAFLPMTSSKGKRFNLSNTFKKISNYEKEWTSLEFLSIQAFPTQVFFGVKNISTKLYKLCPALCTGKERFATTVGMFHEFLLILVVVVASVVSI